MVILLGDAALVLKDFVDGCISLTVTSPPYDNLRTYGGYSFNFETIAKELYRITKDGGIVVWIVGDATDNGTESLTSFKQAIKFNAIGFNLHDTMIYEKSGWQFPQSTRYNQAFEYMFVLSKGRPKTLNLMRDRMNKHSIQIDNPMKREANAQRQPRQQYLRQHFGLRGNIWKYAVGNNNSSNDKSVFDHPAVMPEELAQDHIKSWSNEGDLILDPFAGSGTTLKAAQQLNRKWIGIEINPDYVQLAKKRLTPYVQQQRLESFPLEL